VQLVAPAKDAVVKAVVAKLTDSPEPKPVALMTAPASDCSGKPLFIVVEENASEIFGVIVNEVLTEFVPSLTTMVSAPPGIAGTVTVVSKFPIAVVVRHEPPLVTQRLFLVPIPPYAPVKAPEQVLALAEVNHVIVVVPTVDVISMGLLLKNPEPLMTRDEPTVPAVAAVWTPLDIVDRVTVAPAAWAGEAGSRKTIPAIPARNSSPIVPIEASLLFGVNCICILFTYFRNF